MLFQLNPNILPRVSLINSVTIMPPFVHKKRKTDEYIIYIIKKGTMYLIENDQEYILKEGDFFLLDPEYAHQGFKAAFCEYYYIHFQHPDITKVHFPSDSALAEFIASKRNISLKSDAASYSIYESDRCLFPKYYNFSNYNTFITCTNLLNQAIEQNSNYLENYKILCSCSVLAFLIETFRSYVLTDIENISYGVPKSYKKVQDLLTFLNTEYPNKITSEEIEETFDCNFDYLNRIFRRLTQKTIFTYLNNVRINHAKELITTTALTLSEIAASVGISDEYYFSKVFKKYTGVSPKNYAKGILK